MQPVFQTKQKTKGELLIQRLDRIKKNSESIMQKMDNKISQMQQVKDDLNGKSVRMTQWTNKFQNLITLMGGNMFGGGSDPFKRKEGELGPRKESVRNVCKKLMGVKTVCLLTGAGVSKGVGIPTFRDKDGLYRNNFVITAKNSDKVQYTPQQFLTLKTFKQYPEQIWKWCQSIKKLVQEKNPGPEHQIINMICQSLKKMGKQVTLVTTNIDSLHKKVLQRNKTECKYDLHEIHGNFRKYICSECFHQYPPESQPQIFTCNHCQNPHLRPFIMFFDQSYTPTFDPTNLRSQSFDLIFVIGTSLQTGLSVKLVSSSSIVVQINPRCVVESGEVYRFQEECQAVLAQFLAELEIAGVVHKRQ